MPPSPHAPEPADAKSAPAERGSDGQEKLDAVWKDFLPAARDALLLASGVQGPPKALVLPDADCQVR